MRRIFSIQVVSLKFFRAHRSLNPAPRLYISRYQQSCTLEHIGHIAANLEPFVRHYGVFAVSLILAFESLGAPLPGETLLIFGSVLAQRGEISLPALLIFAWAGSVLGDNVGYLVGKTIGRATITRYGGKIGLTDARMSAVEEMFSRYGPATVLFARFFAVLRQLNGIVAGTLGIGGASCCSMQSAR